MIEDIIRAYHDLLTDEVAEEADAFMRQRLQENNLYFGDRPLCVVLRPHFYLYEDWRYIKWALEALLTAFQRAHDACFDNAQLRARLYLHDYEEQLFEWDRGGPPPWSSSRLDTFFSIAPRGLKVVEYNAETPAGIGYGDVLADVFDTLEPMRRFRERYQLQALPGLDHLATSITDAYKQWGGRETPQIAIMDWRDVPTIHEHSITKTYFETSGYRTVLADPRSVAYHDGHLWLEDFRIDIIYKRVLYGELIETMGLENAVLNAVRDRAVYITNAPSCKLLDKKASLAFLSDERHAHIFTYGQRQVIEAHIPWTRIVEERQTVFHGTPVDLVPFVAQYRERFVLKPNDDYGGRGVVLGWQSSSDGWEAALKQALATPHVVQERVAPVQRDFPMWLNGVVDISPRFVDADPYVFNGGSVRGVLTRLSSLALLNVTAGGGSLVPTYIVQTA